MYRPQVVFADLEDERVVHLLHTSQDADAVAGGHKQETAEVWHVMSWDEGESWGAPELHDWEPFGAAGTFLKSPPLALPGPRWLMPIYHTPRCALAHCCRCWSNARAGVCSNRRARVRVCVFDCASAPAPPARRRGKKTHYSEAALGDSLARGSPWRVARLSARPRHYRLHFPVSQAGAASAAL